MRPTPTWWVINIDYKGILCNNWSITYIKHIDWLQPILMFSKNHPPIIMYWYIINEYIYSWEQCRQQAGCICVNPQSTYCVDCFQSPQFYIINQPKINPSYISAIYKFPECSRTFQNSLKYSLSHLYYYYYYVLLCIFLTWTYVIFTTDTFQDA